MFEYAWLPAKKGYKQSLGCNNQTQKPYTWRTQTRSRKHTRSQGSCNLFRKMVTSTIAYVLDRFRRHQRQCITVTELGDGSIVDRQGVHGVLRIACDFLLDFQEVRQAQFSSLHGCVSLQNHESFASDETQNETPGKSRILRRNI